MKALDYVAGYASGTVEAVRRLVETEQLGAYLQKKYPEPHACTSDRLLFAYADAIRCESMRHAPPLAKVLYDGKIRSVNQALGLHTYARRVQGGKIRTRSEIRIAGVFRRAPEALLRMIVVHELAHLKEKAHDRAFYRLCEHMEPRYHELEFDARLFLIHLEHFGALYPETPAADSATVI